MTLGIELLIIGNEILSGCIQDTNSNWLAKRLLQLGLPVQRIEVIPDVVNIIANAIRRSCALNTQILITSGGLGPTFDDRTAAGLAKAVEKPLKLHKSALEMVRKRYKELYVQGLVEFPDLTDVRRKMALLPKEAKPLKNRVGTAPGIFYQIENTKIFCLPGVPQELKAIYNSEVEPHLVPYATQIILEDIIQVPLQDESILAPIISNLMNDEQGVYLKSMPRPYQSKTSLRVAITVYAKAKAEAKARLNQITKRLQEAAKNPSPNTLGKNSN